jgi:hypothetical protein
MTICHKPNDLFKSKPTKKKFPCDHKSCGTNKCDKNCQLLPEKDEKYVIRNLVRRQKFTFDVYPMKPGETPNGYIWSQSEHKKLMHALRERVEKGLFIKPGVEFTDGDCSSYDDTGNDAIGVCDFIEPTIGGGVRITATLFFEYLDRFGVKEDDILNDRYVLGTVVHGELKENFVKLDKVQCLTFGLRCGYDCSIFNCDYRDALVGIGKALGQLQPTVNELQDELSDCQKIWTELDQKELQTDIDKEIQDGEDRLKKIDTVIKAGKKFYKTIDRSCSPKGVGSKQCQS